MSLTFLSKLNLDLNNTTNLYVINLTQESVDNLSESEKEETYSTILGRVKSINGNDLKTHF